MVKPKVLGTHGDITVSENRGSSICLVLEVDPEKGTKQWQRCQTYPEHPSIHRQPDFPEWTLWGEAGRRKGARGGEITRRTASRQRQERTGSLGKKAWVWAN